MTARRVVLALLLLLIAAWPARGNDVPLGDGKLARARVGWNGVAVGFAPVPVVVTLVNREPRERTVTVSVVADVGPGGLESVALAPGARKRIRFHTHVGIELTVSVREGEAVLGSERFRVRRVVQDVVLVVDGAPDTLVVPEVAVGAVAIPVPVDEVSEEVSALSGFTAVVLREVDPLRLEPDARAALDELVRAGGTVVVTASDEKAGRRAFYEETPGPEDRSGPFPVKHAGLGRVVLVEDDPSAATGSSQVQRALLGTLVLRSPPCGYPRVANFSRRNEAALRAALVAFSFVALELLLVGPVFALAFRRAGPRRAAVALAVVLALCLAGGVGVALWVRGSASVVRVTSFVVVPEKGDAVVLSDVVVHSGGSRSFELELEGPALALTEFDGPVAFASQRGMPVPLLRRTRTQRTVAGRPLRCSGRVAPFGTADFAVFATVPAPRGLEARIERGGAAIVAENDGTAPLGPAFARSLGSRRVAFLERIAAGDRVVSPFETRSEGERLGLPAALGFLERHEVMGWQELVPMRRDGLPPRHVLLLEESEPPFAVRSPAALVEHRAFRVVEVPGEPPRVPGWLGLVVSPSFRGATIVRVEPGSPAALREWRFRKGRTVTAVAGVPIGSQEDLDRVLAHVGPGERILVAADGGSDWLVTTTPPSLVPRGAKKK